MKKSSNFWWEACLKKLKIALSKNTPWNSNESYKHWYPRTFETSPTSGPYPPPE